MTFILIFKAIFTVKFEAKGRGTVYHPEIKSVSVTKWSQTIASLPEHLTQP